MPEQNKLEQEIVAIVAAGFNQEQRQEEPDTERTQEEGERAVFDVDLYRLKGGAVLLVPYDGTNPLDRNAVESNVTPTEVTDSTETPTISLTPRIEQEIEPATEISLPLQHHYRVKPSHVLMSLMLLFILTAGTLTYVFALPLTASADVTITPLTRTLEKTTTLTIATTAHAGQVQGRILQGVSLSKSTTVPATGHGHQDAMQATGVITFYNADSQSYTIPAGVTFPVDSVYIVTDASVTIQAAIPPVFGQAIISAHATQAGSVGNIPARAINTRCCGSELITATNVQAFTGGQGERSYSFVQSSDIQNATQTLLPQLTSQVTKALYTQLHAGEQLVTALCTPRTTADHQPREEATEITVSVSQTCSSIAYSQDSLADVGAAFLAQSQNLTNYEQVGTVQVTVNGSTVEQKTARLQVTLSGTWVYRFTQHDLTTLKRMIAGVSKARAPTLLAREPGVKLVTISLKRFDFRDQLPTDPTHIRIIVIVS